MAILRLDKYIRRYTTLSSALDTLVNHKLVLLSPSKWDDTNDTAFMELYRSAKNVEATLALCCTMATETYHHWRIFTQGMEGVCIEFDRLALSRSLSADTEVQFGRVKYVNVGGLEAMGTADVDQLPFLKRLGFRDEREWRVLVNCMEPAKHTYDVEIELSAIKRIILNPWLPPPLSANLRGIIRKIPGCEKLKIESSGLTNSTRWKAAGKNIAL